MSILIEKTTDSLQEPGQEADVFDSGEALQTAFWRQIDDLVLLDIEIIGSRYPIFFWEQQLLSEGIGQAFPAG